MVNKKTWFIIAIILAVVIIFFMVFRLGGEDSWIKDERGVWIKHGVPAETPQHVKEQQELIGEAEQLCQQKKQEMQLESQCLGSVGNGDYVVDIVHVPRAEEDNQIENQCQDYREGRASHFIEFDKECSLVRIV